MMGQTFFKKLPAADFKAMVSLFPVSNSTKHSHNGLCMPVNIYNEFPFVGCWVQLLQLIHHEGLLCVNSSRLLREACDLSVSLRQHRLPVLPSPHPSIQRDSAEVRWKPLAMIYGISSAGVPVELLPPSSWWGNYLPDAKTKTGSINPHWTTSALQSLYYNLVVILFLQRY